MRHAYFDLPVPLSLGHRGAAAHAPENTLLSFERALALGAHILESDLHVTRDGVPILLHDPSVDRTTQGSGPADSLSVAELKKLDAAYRFGEADGFPHRGGGIEIPTLEEAFRAFPAARFNLEIKARAPGLCESVIELVRRFDREDRTLLTAGEDDIMRTLRRALAESGLAPAVGACTADVAAVVRSARDGRAPPADAMALQIPAEFAGRPLVTRELLAHAHAHEIQIHVWTINEPDAIEALLQLGVDGIVSDFPERVLAAAEAVRERG